LLGFLFLTSSAALQRPVPVPDAPGVAIGTGWMVLPGGFDIARVSLFPFVRVLMPVVAEWPAVEPALVPVEPGAVAPAATPPAAPPLAAPPPAASAIEESMARTETKTIVVNFMVRSLVVETYQRRSRLHRS
jgi:hypothetical protein